MLDDNKQAPRVPFFCRPLWALGVMGLPLAHWCLFAKIEPFYTPIYAYLWWPFIFTVDFMVFLVRKRSMLQERPREFLLLTLWSTPVWLFFEVLNIRMQNWWYVQVPIGMNARSLPLLFSYATVLPGIFEVAELVQGFIERLAPGGRIRGRPFQVTRAHVSLQMGGGGLMLALMLLWPRDFYALAWGFAFLLLDPLCWKLKGRSILGQIASADNTRLVALLVSGFLCGGLWEAWNLGARTKWIYTVPFFDELKLGEMPVLGFLGFPPFALECYAIVNFINLFRGGRSWELSREENRRLRGMAARRAIVSWAATFCLTLVSAALVFASTQVSCSIPLSHYYYGVEFGYAGAEALQRAGADETHTFLKLKDPPSGISPEKFEKLRELCIMAEIKGMGLVHAARLQTLGIRTPADLARSHAPSIHNLIRLRYGEGIAPPLEVIALWIRSARRMTGETSCS
jgi:hypothetical protein